MEEESRKKFKNFPTPEEIKNCILSTEEPVVFKNILSWTFLNWSLNDWIQNLGDIDLDLRIGSKKCAKVPQWENKCDVTRAPLKELFSNAANHESNDQWMYFDYKHMKMHFKNKNELLESISWADFGYPDKGGKDSTIWIGTQGAYTPCHMDSYGCNLVAQVYGRKLWVMFPPCKTSVLKPTRVPYEESSVYSNIHFTCGLNVGEELGEARVVELLPGDVLVVPRHWWHYVENLTTAISINMWIPLKSDEKSRLEEALVRFFVALTLKTLSVTVESTLLNPNEMDLLDEPVDIRQISWCLNQLNIQEALNSNEESQLKWHKVFMETVPSVPAVELQNMLLQKCGCVKDSNDSDKPQKLPLSIENVISAFCHPQVIAKVAELLK